MLRRVFRGLCKSSNGLTLVAGAIGVLTGFERLMGGCARPRPDLPVRPLAPRTGYFDIKRTRSELGYTYWVLHGFGQYRCFVLFDTWREAMDEAVVRVRAAAPGHTDVVAAAPDKCPILTASVP
jgi:hypothetical protein